MGLNKIKNVIVTFYLTIPILYTQNIIKLYVILRRKVWIVRYKLKKKSQIPFFILWQKKKKNSCKM